jgi:alpha-D-xyloside xylohydrolase
VAPVVEKGIEQRKVYLPAGASWTNAYTGEEVKGGVELEVSARLEEIPLFYRDGARLPIFEDIK